MAEVFAGSVVGVEGFERRVAVKRMFSGLSNDSHFARMFTAEAQITSRLVHPNIVSVIDFDRDEENRLFLVMELVEGRDLGSLLARGPLPNDVTAYIATELLRGLAYAHGPTAGSNGRGLIHRDLSPANVLLSWKGAVKIADFGLAKVRGAAEASTSVLLKGQPAYMSPEQASGAVLDGRSDLFAVGVLMWEMLVGQRLFCAADVRGTLESVLFTSIPRPRQHRSTVPSELDRVVMTLLERPLGRRYQSADSVISDLVSWVGDPAVSRERLIGILGARFRGSGSPPDDSQSKPTRSDGFVSVRRAGRTVALVAVIGVALVISTIFLASSTRAHESGVEATVLVSDGGSVRDAPVPDAVVYPINRFVDRANLRHCVVYEAELERLLRCPDFGNRVRDALVDELAGLKLDLAGHTNAALEPKSLEKYCAGRIVDLYRAYPECRDDPQHRAPDLRSVPPRCVAFMNELARLASCPAYGAHGAEFLTLVDRMVEKFDRVHRLEIDVTPILEMLDATCETDRKRYVELGRGMGC